MHNPTFSIIIPTYNRASLVERAIKSALVQTLHDFELIIIDDGSTDDTEGIVKSFNDPRLIYKKFADNKGVNTARNHGLDIARGRYINFFDSDDELLPNALEIFLMLWRQTKDEKIGNVVTRCIDSKTGEKIGYLEKDALVLGYKDIICRKKAKGEFRSSWKKDAIGNMRFEEDIFAQESIFWWRLAKKWDFFYKDIPTAVYYKGSALNLCSIDTQIKHASQMAGGAEILLNEHSQAWIDHCPERYELYLNSAGLWNLLAGNRRSAKHWIRLSLKHNFSLKSWGLIIFYFLPKKMITAIIKLRRMIKSGEVNY